MSHARAATMTPEEFLAWEAKQEGMWEFDGFRPVAMNGGTVEHGMIRRNLDVALASRLRGGSCRVLGPEMRVPTGAGRYRFPDALVTCQPVPRGTKEVADPLIIFEVLSPSTGRVDRGTKLIEYRSVPSLRRYVMIEQDEALVTVVARMDEIWSIDVFRADEALTLPEVGIEIPISELYAGVELLPMEELDVARAGCADDA